MSPLRPHSLLLLLALGGCTSQGIATTEDLVVSAPRATERASTPATPAAPVALARAPHDGQRHGPSTGDWEYMLGGSGSNDDDFDVGSGGLAASVGYFFDDSNELGVRQSVGFSDFGDSAYNASTRVFFDHHFNGFQVVPLIGVNLGMVYGDTVEETFAAAPEVGVKWHVTDTAFVFGLAEYQFFFKDASGANEAFDDGSFVYSVGIGLIL